MPVRVRMDRIVLVLRSRSRSRIAQRERERLRERERISVAPGNEFYQRPGMRNRRRRNHAGHRDRRRNQRPRAKHRAGIQDGIAANLRCVAKDRAEFPQAGLEHRIAGAHDDSLLIEPKIRANRAG